MECGRERFERGSAWKKRSGQKKLKRREGENQGKKKKSTNAKGNRKEKKKRGGEGKKCVWQGREKKEKEAVEASKSKELGVRGLKKKTNCLWNQIPRKRQRGVGGRGGGGGVGRAGGSGLQNSSK